MVPEKTVNVKQFFSSQQFFMYTLFCKDFFFYKGEFSFFTRKVLKYTVLLSFVQNRFTYLMTDCFQFFTKTVHKNLTPSKVASDTSHPEMRTLPDLCILLVFFYLTPTKNFTFYQWQNCNL